MASPIQPDEQFDTILRKLTKKMVREFHPAVFQYCKYELARPTCMRRLQNGGRGGNPTAIPSLLQARNGTSRLIFVRQTIGGRFILLSATALVPRFWLYAR